MKGDFSRWTFDPADNFTGVLSQQGRVFSDTDVTAITQIAGHWRGTVGRDAIGPDIVAAPAEAAGSFRVTAARSNGAIVQLTLQPGRVWADGLLLHSPAATPFVRQATYAGVPFQAPPASAATIGGATHDAVFLEAWEEAVSAFQEPVKLLEPALGGPDTTERSRMCFALRLLRVGPNDDCASVAARLADDLGTRGRLTVTPGPSLFLPGECPLEAGGGYTGLEHYLYRIEIADPQGNQARFKWSRFNGGLVGRGTFASTGAATGTVDIAANAPAINNCGWGSFYLEALTLDTALGYYRVALTATATLTQPGRLDLTAIQGTWPVAAPAEAFFRLWNGIARIVDFSNAAVELEAGIQLRFQAPVANLANYRPGDYWTFPVRASGTPMDPSLWPSNAAPQGVRYHRAALAVIHWRANRTARHDRGEIDDCRRVFRPLTNQKICCTYTVGDGVSTHGDFDSIEEALSHLPAGGGQLCLMPGLHRTNAQIRNRINVKIVGCGVRTRVVPRQGQLNAPLFHVVDSLSVSLEQMDLVSMAGIAVLAEGARPGTLRDFEVAHNRILACTHAVRIVNGERVLIQHNRIRMLDRVDGDVALHMEGDDGLIERNEIDIVPSLQMPPIDNPDGGPPIDPTDPCAALELVYPHRLPFLRYVSLVWGLGVTLLPAAPYRALGGIRLAAGCERVRVLENTVRGGAGNGVTLGSAVVLPPPPAAPPAEEHRVTSNGMILGSVTTPAGTSAGGIQLTFTNVATGYSVSTVTAANGDFRVMHVPPGNYRVAVGAPGLVIESIQVVNLAAARLHLLTLVAVAPAPEPAGFGFLYDIAIERNRIVEMGLSGIGVPPPPGGAAFDDARVPALARYLHLLGTPVLGLSIESNLIANCLRNPFNAELREQARRRGVGGISLGLCQDTAIRQNRIEDCGLRHVDPICGIYIAYGEMVEITLNEVRNNGRLAAGGNDLTPGRRGGIVLDLVTAFTGLDTYTGTGVTRARMQPAARIHENVVDQPAGLALHVLALGPLLITDNTFSNEVSGVSDSERLAGTVLVLNVGGAQYRPPSAQVAAGGNVLGAVAADGVGGAGGGAAGAGTNASVAAPSLAAVGSFTRLDFTPQILPVGTTTFCNNQSRTGPAVTSLSSHMVTAMDDLDYSHNQSRNLQAQGLFCNVMLGATTLRASGNRMSETDADTLLSLGSLGGRLNATTYNQGDNCIVVVGADPAYPEVRDGNMVLDNAGCGVLNAIAEYLFTQRG